jgi:hypothetical protein
MTNPLLAEPTAEQRRLLEAIWEPYIIWDRWPIYQWVDLQLDRQGIDANATLASCPTLRSRFGLGGYGWTWSTGNPGVHSDDDTVGLTVMGMHWVAAAQGEASRFLKMLQLFVHLARNMQPSATEVQVASLTAEEVRAYLALAPFSNVRRLGDVLRHEPSTMAFVSHPDGHGMWTATLDSRIRGYAGVTNTAEYAGHLQEIISPIRPAAPPSPWSSLALPEAIDYLNAVWHLHFGADLIGIARSTAAAELTYECESTLEFDSRITALYTIFSQIRIPGGTQSGKPTGLKKFLTKHPNLKSQPRAVAAAETLETLFRFRAWRHHPDATDGPEALRRLGVSHPIYDWGAAWRTITERVVDSLNALREEVDLLPLP